MSFNTVQITLERNMISDSVQNPTGGKRVRFFNAEIDPLTVGETLQTVEGIIHSRSVTQHVVVNVAKLVMMQKDEKLRRIVNSCGLINADGWGVVWGANLLGLKIPERVAGIDLFLRLVELSAEKGYRPYFLGAKQEIVEKVVRQFRSNYSNLEIAGYRNGYFKEEEEFKIAKEIGQSRADILFVAMSSPKKELFLNQYSPLMEVPFVMGVGGSFDVVAGHVKRAPLWMQEMGLEWFYRLLSEPGRMWKRYLVTNTIFLGMILKALLFKNDLDS
jgi:N-acetylglucosaminyldiphosphoundecaprenol N-acetyl-beta-D-mannosaminyltransferase